MNPPLSLLRPTPLRVGSLLVAAFSIVAFIPSLFAGPGYESALLSGLFLPAVTSICTAFEVRRTQPEPVNAVAAGLRTGAALSILCYALSVLHGLRAGLCDIAGGSLHFLLGPIAGSLLAGCFGAVSGHVASLFSTPRRQRAACACLGLLAPLVSIGISLYRFYTSPMVFAFDPFVGFFSGTLYDTVIEWTGLLSYRAGTLLTVLAFLAAAALLRRDPEKRLGIALAGDKLRLDLGAAFVVLLSGSFLLWLQGPVFGHYQSSQGIAEVLGARLESRRCTIVYASSIPEADAKRFAMECDAHVEQGQRFFNAPIPFRITAYLFADASQKAALMGAANTYVAKPWRREVYVQQNGFPHPVLGHEIMHVLAGAFARGPFKIAGSFYGILPDPGLIEGIAVAAAPREGDLRPAEWAKAMKDLGLLPRLKSLFALGFLGHNAALAYTVSGAFVEYIHAQYGASVVRSWYGGADLQALAGHSWDELEQAFHKELDSLSLSEAAMAQAKARFDRPAIFGRHCPHVVDACKQRGDAYRTAGDFVKAMLEYERAIQLDPHDPGLSMAMAKNLFRMGRLDEANARLLRLAGDQELPAALRDKAREELGDIDLALGHADAAVQHYSSAREHTVDEDTLRTLDVKLLAARVESVRAPIVALLIGVPGELPDKYLAIDKLSAWAERDPENGLPPYLLARHYMGAANYAEASIRLKRALSGPIEIPRVRVEARRMAIITACALGDIEGTRVAFEGFKQERGVSGARMQAVESFVQRCVGVF